MIIEWPQLILFNYVMRELPSIHCMVGINFLVKSALEKGSFISSGIYAVPDSKPGLKMVLNKNSR